MTAWVRYSSNAISAIKRNGAVSADGSLAITPSIPMKHRKMPASSARITTWLIHCRDGGMISREKAYFDAKYKIAHKNV